MQNTTYKTNYRVSGSGDPVVLIHGVGLNQSMWQAQRSVLAEHYQVITYDMLGHGASENPPQQATLEHYTIQLEQLLQRLNIHSTIAVIGFSMGALIARNFVLKHQNSVHRLVLLNGVFERTKTQKEAVLTRAQEASRSGPSSNIDAAIQRWFTPAYIEKNRAQIHTIKTNFANNNAESYAMSYHLFALHDSYKKELLHTIRVPTLIVTGEHDYGSTPDMAYQLAQYIPNAKVMIVKNQRHMMLIESAHKINQILLSFLDSDTVA